MFSELLSVIELNFFKQFIQFEFCGFYFFLAIKISCGILVDNQVYNETVVDQSVNS